MARTLAPARQYVCRLDGANVARFGAIVDRSGVLDLLTTWREEDRAAAGKTNTGGRPRYISDRTMLIAFLVVATSNSPLHITRVAGLICAEHTTDTAREALGLPTSAEAERVGDAYDKQYTRWYHRAHNALHRILDVVDLFPDTPTKRRLTHKELADILDNRDEALVLKRRGRATEFFNRLVWASYEELPEKYRENWKGDVTVDGTLLKGAYTGTRKLRAGDDPNLVRTSSEPDAAWYVRDGDHKATDKALKNAKSEAHWGYEATVIAGVIRDGGAYKQPHLIMGISLDKPGHHIAERAIDAMRHVIADADAPRGTFVGDRAYLYGAHQDKLQLPLLRAGYDLLGDYRDDHVGKHTHHEGMTMVDGHWYCPAMPKTLMDATADFRKGNITAEQYREAIETRNKYLMRELAANNGVSRKMVCPGRKEGKTLNCPFVQARERRDAQAKRLPHVIEAQIDTRFNGERHKCCTNKASISIPLKVGAKFVQTSHPYKTEAWQRDYGTFRNVIETRNDLLKNGGANSAGIGDHKRRLVRGFTAAWFFTAIGSMVVNIKLIDGFLFRVAHDIASPTPPPPEPDTPRGRRRVLDIRSNAPPMVA